MSAKEIIVKEKIASIFLLLPVILVWTPTVTSGLKFDIFGFPYFWPSFIYLIYYWLSPKRRLSQSSHIIVRLVTLVLLISPFSLVFFNNGDYAFSLFFHSLSFFIILYIFILKPPTENQIHYLKWIIIGLYFYVEIQAILSTLGIWQYSEVELEDKAMSFFRARTKVGDSNQTCAILYLFTILITSYYVKNTLLNLSIILLTFITITMCAVRGAFLTMIIYMFVYFYTLFKKSRLIYKFIFFIGITFIVGYVYNLGVFDDILLRSEILSSHGDLTAGREDRVDYVFKTAVTDSPIIGVGTGRVYPTTHTLAKSSNDGFRYSSYIAAPHNVWVLFLGEFGIVGVICFLISAFLIVKKLSFKEPISWAVICVFLINMNTEAILIHGEVLTFICLLICASIYTSKNRVKSNLIV